MQPFRGPGRDLPFTERIKLVHQAIDRVARQTSAFSLEHTRLALN